MDFLLVNFYIIPEVFLFCSLLTFLCFFVMYTKNVVSSGKLLTLQFGSIVISFFVMLSCLYSNLLNLNIVIFDNIFMRQEIGTFLVLCVLLSSVFLFLVSKNYITFNNIEYEFYILICLVVLGMICVLYANDFISFYVSIELQSLGLYILAAIKHNSTFSTEAGLKYLILGAFATSLLLYGIVLCYGLTGILNFYDLSYFFYNLENSNLLLNKGIILSFIFIFVSLIFKLGGAPFHMWVPDVYEGVGTLITAFFSIVPKIVLLGFLFKLVSICSFTIFHEFTGLFMFSALLSIAIGSINALTQQNLKRILSYSAIAHTGFLLFSFAVNNFESMLSIMLYLIVYVIVQINIFAIILNTQQNYNGIGLKLINNLSYLYKSNKFLGISFILGLFSIAGIPPLSGFFTKFYILLSGIREEYYLASFLAIIISVISVAYYLRLIRVISFLQNKKKWLFFAPVNKTSSYVISFTLLANLFFMFIGGTFYVFIYNLSLLYFY